MKETKEIKETKQKSLDLGEYIEGIEKQLETGFVGLITDVSQATNSVYFGDTSGKYEERDGIVVTVKLRGDDATSFTQWFGKPRLRGYEQSNIFKFKEKYRSIPMKGMEVTCKIDENGFFKMDF